MVDTEFTDAELEKLPLKTIALRWILSQGATTMLLVAILYAMWYFATYAVNVGIPAHLKQIQEGYNEQGKAHTQEVEKLAASFEKALDRIDRLHNNHGSLPPNGHIAKPCQE